MTFTKTYYFNKENIKKFYMIIDNADFHSIDEERRQELDIICNNYYSIFHNKFSDKLFLLSYLCEKLYASSSMLGLKNINEMAYFYIKIVDPELYFLKFYESSNTLEEVITQCKNYFHYYDKQIILLEKKYNKFFKDFDENELWSQMTR